MKLDTSTTSGPRLAARALDREESRAARILPQVGCIHRWFEEQVERTPDRIAAEFENRQFTYQELNRRANRLARHLESLGVEREEPVGICVERGLEMLVGLLAILKAGAAYVPMDPTFPTERLAHMLEDSDTRVLLTQSHFTWAGRDSGNGASGPSFRSNRADFQAVLLDQDEPLISRQHDGNSTAPISPDGRAQVIFTSGSTGRPKGVEITHRSVVNVLACLQEAPGLDPDDVMLAIATLSFDIAGVELFLPIVTGARVVIVSRELARDGKRLAKELTHRGITVLQATPSTWRMLVDAGWKGDGRLKMFAGGEALTRDLARELLSRGGELWNLYGPTETTIYSTKHRVRAEDDKVLIGQPVANTEVYILDENQRPVAPGESGELYIGGTGMARGYLGQPKLTAERFVPNPFAASAGARMYRTGDSTRWAADGSIEYLGRLDQQVKIRGVRMELGEIESILTTHPRVRQCVVHVDAREHNKRLVAYVVAADAARPGVEELREHLGRHLPDIMVPRFYVFLDAMPLTGSGKVDRKALPPPEEGALTKEALFVAPTDDLEFKLAKIWEEVLGKTPLGIADNFFDLGGDSLMSVNLVTRIEKELGESLSLPDIVAAPTVETLARRLRNTGCDSRQHSVVPLQPLGNHPPLFCLNWTFFYRHLARQLAPEQPVYGVYSPIETELRTFAEGKPVSLTVEELASRYVRLIREVQPRGPYHLAGISFGGVLAFEVAHQLTRAGEKVALLALLDALLPRSWIPRPFPQLRRMMHHAREFLRHGPGYLREKLARRRARGLHEERGVKYPVEPDQQRNLTTEQVEQRRVWFMNTLLAHYAPRPYSGKAVLLRAQQPVNSFNYRLDDANGWTDLVAELKVEMVPGGHNDLGNESNAPLIAQKIRQYLSRMAAWTATPSIYSHLLEIQTEANAWIPVL